MAGHASRPRDPHESNQAPPGIPHDEEPGAAREEALCLAAQVAGFGAYDLDFASEQFFFSPELKTLLGLPASARLGLDTDLCPEFVHADDKPEVARVLRAACAASATGSVQNEYRVVRADGSVRWVMDRGQIACEDVGIERRPLRATGILVDITARKQREQHWRESAEQFRALADHIAPFAWIADESGWIFWYNQRWFDYTGTTLETMQGWGWQQVHHPDHVQRVTDKFRRSIETGEAWEDTFPLRGRDGAYRWFLSRAFPVRDESGRIRQWFGTNTDITEQRETAEALSESSARFRGLAEGLPHTVWETDAAGMNLYQNQAWYDYVGAGPGGSFGQDWLNYYHPEDRPHLLAKWTESLRTEGAHAYDIEVRIRRHDGAYRWFRVKGAPIRNAAGVVVRWAGSCTDIDDQKRAEAALRESEERFRLMADSSPLMIWTTDAQAGVRFVNRAYCEFFGKTQAEVEGQGWQPLVHPDDAARYSGAFVEAISARRPFHAVARVRRADGEWRWIESFGRPIVSPSGDIIGYVGSSPDITERLRAEEALKQADQRKDEFLATLAHELRNPLSPIRTSADIVRMNAGANARLKWAGEVITRQVEHLDHLVNDLLDLSRIAQGKFLLKPEQCDLRTIVWRAVEMNRRSLDAKSHRFSASLPDQDLVLRADVPRMVQVVSNLINNAIKYTPPGGSISISARAENGEVVLRVKDTGVGIKPELLPHIFDLFVQGDRSLARTEGGLGIGLTLVRKMTELHGGRVEVASPGANRGAEFIVRLPRVTQPASEQAAADTPIYDASTNPRRILIVEDNRDAADSLAALLGDLGHKVSICYDGTEGLKQAIALLPEVVILDIGLPGLSGHELARLLRQDPRLKQAMLVAISGYGQSADREESQAAGFDHHLLKPFHLDELVPILSAATEPRPPHA